MIKNNLKIFIQATSLCFFCFMAVASASQQSVGSSTNWNSMGRSALIGAGAAHDGYNYIGTASSEAEARNLAASKGYSKYIWDTNSGYVYGK